MVAWLAWSGLALVCVGALLWPSARADPRTVLWRSRTGRRGSSADRGSPATDVAVVALLLVISLRTGLPVVVALERVAGYCRSDVAADLLRVVTAYERDGDRAHDAWETLPDCWQPIAGALRVANRAGVAPGSLLRSAARTILRRESVVQETAIGRAGVRLVLPLGTVLLPAFMATTVLPLVLAMTGDHLAP